MSDHIKEYLAQAQTCSFCDGPFFESYITRGRFIERSGRQVVALEYRLCSAHWNDESDRVKALFAPIPNTAPIHRIAASSNVNKHLVNTDGLEPTLSTSSLVLHCQLHLHPLICYNHHVQDVHSLATDIVPIVISALVQDKDPHHLLFPYHHLHHPNYHIAAIQAHH